MTYRGRKTKQKIKKGESLQAWTAHAFIHFLEHYSAKHCIAVDVAAGSCYLDFGEVKTGYLQLL